MKIEIVLYEGFEELDALGPFEVLAAAGLAPTLVTLDRSDQVTGAHGAVMVPSGTLSERPDLLVVPGGGWEGRRDRGAWGEARRGTLPRALALRHQAGATLAGVCTGTMLIAAAELLAGRPAVTHHRALESLAATGCNVIPSARVVDDGHILTSAGVTAGIDLALRLVERQLGAPAAERVARQIEYPRQGSLHLGPNASREPIRGADSETGFRT
ncbi:MAG: DJ-1/PfpI family protein [Solirubrobacterales bacterium]|nr:DJ-1/PfpI family protein [Solirubrobacterales bacterium]